MFHPPSANLPKPLKQLIGQDQGTLGALWANSAQVRQLNYRLQGLLRDASVGQVEAVALKAGQLTLGVRSGGWALKLRYQLPDLLQGLRQFPEGQGLVGLKIKVLPPNADLVAKRMEGKPRTLSTKNKENLESVADCLHEPRIRRALKNFIANLEKERKP